MDRPRVSLSWSLEEAMEATDVAQAQDSQRSWADPTLPIFQFTGLHAVESDRLEYERTGDGYFVLRAIRICCNHDLVMPDWVGKAFIKAFDSVNSFHAASWDEVFGRPNPKGIHLSRLRHRRMHAMPVYRRVKQLHSQDVPIDERLFKLVGKEFGIRKTKASEYYYYWYHFFASAKNKKFPERLKR